MAAILNKYFNKAVAIEQTLFQNIKTESIQVMGRMYYYIPRQVAKIDKILGEDTSSKFEDAIPIEMYMEEVNGFTGDNELYGKFGLEIASSYTLIVSRSRWEAEVIKPEYNYMLVKNRPQEGDLIYDPLTKFLMVIKFTDHDSEFYQISKNYIYKLSCEAFQYSSEELNTGIAEIDGLEDLLSNDLLADQLQNETGVNILQENGSAIIQDIPDIPDFTSGKDSYDRTKDFEEFGTKLKYSVSNPFDGR